MSALHTPGEWSYRAQGDADSWAMVTVDGRWVISFRQNGEMMPAEQEANAKLMASAPRLLQTLSDLAEAMELAAQGGGVNFHAYAQQARAAIDGARL